MPDATWTPGDDAGHLAPVIGLHDGDVSTRESHVFVFNGRREVLLRRVPSPLGMPHAERWTTGIVVPVAPDESYAIAAARATRDILDVRQVTLRHVGTTWTDDDGARTFLDVYVTAAEGVAATAAPVGCAYVPVHELLRAARREPDVLAPSLARACRLLADDE